LVDEVLAVVVGEFLSTNDPVHVRLHELLESVSKLLLQPGIDELV